MKLRQNFVNIQYRKFKYFYGYKTWFYEDNFTLKLKINFTKFKLKIS